MFEEFSTFLYCVIGNFNTVGALVPSSHALAKAITLEISRKETPACVLEVGAGTGVFTKRLVQILGKEDHLDICEIAPKFIRYLQKILHEHEDFKNFKGTIDFFTEEVQKIPYKERYDFIISSLPLNRFSPESVAEILEVLVQLAKPKGWISYFEYMGVRKLQSLYSRGEKKARIFKIGELLDKFIAEYEVYHTPVWRNFPPAYARHCQKK